MKNTYRRPAEQARDRITGARARLSQLNRALGEELHKARSFTSDDYTAEGLGKRRQELVAQVRAKYAPQLAELQRQVTADAQTIASWTRDWRPSMAADAVGLQRAQMKWDQARMRLEAGMSWQQLVSTADVDTLLAVQEWGPAWLDAQALQANAGRLASTAALPDPVALERALTARFMEVGDSAVQWALQAQSEADVAVAGFTPMASHVKGLVEGYDSGLTPLDAAYASHFAAQMAAPGYGGLEGDPGESGDAA